MYNVERCTAYAEGGNLFCRRFKIGDDEGE